MEITIYIEKRNGKRQKKWSKICEDGYKRFILKLNSEHDFEDEGKQYVDFEAYYLSKILCFMKATETFLQLCHNLRRHSQ